MQSAKRGTRLRFLRVTTITLRRYRQALELLLAFWSATGIDPPDVPAIDDGVAEYIEMLWAEAKPISMANCAVAAVGFFYPSARQGLGLSWSLLKTWRRCEPPVRALPFTPELVLALAGLAVQCEALDIGRLLLVGFAGLLRTTELFSIQRRHVSIIRDKFVIRLPETKTGFRKATAEVVVIDCPLTVRLITPWVEQARLDQRISGRTPYQLRAALKRLLQFFGLVNYRFSWYSCRRGGATYDFMAHRSMESTIMKGRWGSATTAKIYIEQAVADIVQVTPVHETDSLIRYFGSILFTELLGS